MPHRPLNRKRILISCFILFNILAILNSTSKPAGERTALEDFFSPYLNWTRLNQRWLLFTPEPRDYAMRYHVLMEFKNGDQKIWRRPYPPNWDFFARHLAYQFQKWDLASGYLDHNKLVWADLAHFLAYQFHDESNPMVKVTLVRETAEWPPPNESGFVRTDDKFLVWREKPLFSYDLQKESFL